MSGDENGAKQTKQNFLNQMPVVSQVKSILHYSLNEDEAAARSSKQFLLKTVEPLMDNAPVIGHLKGMLHIMTGQNDHGMETLKRATIITAILGGARMGGPIGAICLGIITQGLITGIDSLVYKKYKPYGIFLLYETLSTSFSW